MKREDVIIFVKIGVGFNFEGEVKFELNFRGWVGFRIGKFL